MPESLVILLIIYLAAIGPQILFLTMVIGRFYKYKCEPKPNERPTSVVICARNEEENLKTLLPLLYSQDCAEFEIIVVNDRSGDGTYDFLLEEVKKEPRLKVVTVDHLPDKFNGKKYALTLGIKAAKYDTVLLTDADCIPKSDRWIHNMSAFDGKINLGFSSYARLPGILNSFIRFETIWTGIQYIGLALSGLPYMGVGRNLAYKKSLFLENKGFNGHLEITGGDDDLFINRHTTGKNTSVVIGSEVLMESKPKTSWNTFFRQKLRHLSVGKYYRLKTRLILGMLTISHTFMWALVLTLGFTETELSIVLGSFFIRTLLIYITFIQGCKKLGVKFDLWGLIFFDFIYVFYFLLTGTAAILTKRVKWT